MKTEYDLSKKNSRKNPYVDELNNTADKPKKRNLFNELVEAFDALKAKREIKSNTD